MSTQLLNESPLYRSWRAEAEAEGRAEGRAEGESEGRVKGLRIAARTALEGRFGALDGELVALIDIADEARLTVVLAHIAADTLDQVRERLRPA